MNGNGSSAAEDPENEQQTEVKVITRNDIHLLEHCFTTFLTEEPEHSTYGMDVGKDKEYYVKVCNEKLFLDEAPQFILWDNNEKTVEGMLLTTVFSKDNKLREDAPFHQNSPIEPERERIINDVLKFYDVLMAKYANPVKYSVDKVVYLRTLFVFKEHRCKGKATRLIKAAKDICKSQLGTNIFVALCSNPVATRAFLKAGFELVEELHYTEIDFPGLQLMSKEFLKTSDKISVVAKTD